MTESGPGNSLLPAGRWKRVVLVATLFLLGGVILGALWLYSYAYSTGPDVGKSHVMVTIERGASVREIGGILSQAGLIRGDALFPLMAWLSGKSGSLQAGEFNLATRRSVVEIIDMLVTARPVHRTVTVPEGLNAEEMASLFEQKGLCDRRSYEALVKDKAFIARLGLDGVSSLEGYLFPDTYYLTKDDRGAEKIITKQVERFHAVWEKLVGELEGVELSRSDVVTLASIVEKETGNAAERPLIAGVFHNRLKKGMRLQSDPTVVYGVEDFDGKITRTQLRTATPYNTYLLPGLPVGPIANPGLEAMHAVLHPAETNFLYFVAKNDGTHKFSKNLRDHNRAVQKYQRKKTVKKGKDSK